MDLSPLPPQLTRKSDKIKIIIGRFVDSLPQQQIDVEESFQSKDWPALAAALHNLKGMGGACGYPQVTELAAELEQFAKNENGDELDAGIKNLSTLFERIRLGVDS
jgi:HPt (histidine-containing phosphotransfer) domain-containing protein